MLPQSDFALGGRFFFFHGPLLVVAVSTLAQLGMAAIRPGEAFEVEKGLHRRLVPCGSGATVENLGIRRCEVGFYPHVVKGQARPSLQAQMPKVRNVLLKMSALYWVN